MDKNQLALLGLDTTISDMLKISDNYPLIDFGVGDALRQMSNFSSFMPDLGIAMSPSITSMVSAAQSVTGQMDWVSQISGVNATLGSSLLQMALPTQSESIVGMLGREVKASLDMGEILRISGIGESIFSSATQSLIGSIDTSFLDDLLSQAKDFDLSTVGLDDATDNFFEQQPALSHSIEQLPQFKEFSPADRLILIGFIKVIVTLSVTLGLLELSVDQPAAAIILACLGVSGIPAGNLVGGVINKALTQKSIDGEA